ncbi:FtsW/RodA/SpoVE family cell cycle protein [Neobacillus sp. WH10]|uniref:FtsW/RodA/SpoVE family cell cycle protein n=1 Tax=Neobacillus sp. WH10 TaxID=3047873 RepID=UPI0024C1A3A7|nr:FtsW/RodA/SpoVE family cell cycle protein [Neobacillus sp. WH10]WHY75169.1 FtsW/RodA/SpoVE family cell cycle protein [Neobacillus sp. WH10]
MANKKYIFLNEVTDQIKSKEAKKYVADELGYHLQEAKNSWMEKGLPVAEAEVKAIDQMGSPIKLGKQMNKLHKPKVDWFMIILLVTTLGLGFLPMISLEYMDTRHFSVNKTIIVLLGGTVAIGIMLIDYRKWKTRGWLFYSLGVLLLIVIMCFSNTTINGAPLLRIPSIITIESSKSLPLFFLAWASFFTNEKLKIWQFAILFFVPFLLFFSVHSIPITFIMYTVMVFVMLWWSKFSRKTILFITGSTVGLFMIVAFTYWPFLMTYHKRSLLAFLNPEKDPNGAGYLFLRVNELMSKAGWFGNPVKKEFIPGAHTDFVFVSLTYIYGWLFAIALVIILSLIMVRFIFVSNKIHDSFAKLLLIGAVALYSVQLASNVGMALGVFPHTSISLPFISYGLMPVLLNSFLIGIVLSVYRRKDLLLTRYS